LKGRTFKAYNFFRGPQKDKKPKNEAKRWRCPMKEKEWALKKGSRGMGRYHQAKLGIRLPEMICELLKEEASRRGMTYSSFTRMVIQKGLEALVAERT
jgi:hypothetical protein